MALNSTMQQYTTRVDHRFSDADTFFARYTFFVNYTDNGTAFSAGVVGLRGALTWDFNDTVTIVKGAHTIKVGMEYRLMFGNNYQTANPSGTFNFSTALTDNPQSTFHPPPHRLLNRQGRRAISTILPRCPVVPNKLC